MARSHTKSNRAQQITEKFQQFMDELQAKTQEEIIVAQNNVFWSDVLSYSEDSSEDSHPALKERKLPPPPQQRKETPTTKTRKSLNLIKSISMQMNPQEANKNKVKQLLGIEEKPARIEKKRNIRFKPKAFSPPPLPAEFGVSAFTASRKNEFEEQEKLKESHNKRLMESKKKYRFKRVAKQKNMFINEFESEFDKSSYAKAVYKPEIQPKVVTRKGASSSRNLNAIKPFLQQKEHISKLNQDVKEVMKRQSTFKNIRRDALARSHYESNRVSELPSMMMDQDQMKLERKRLSDYQEIDYDHFKMIFPFNMATCKIAEEMDLKAISLLEDELLILVKKVHTQLKKNI